jgi:hypothetical protein
MESPYDSIDQVPPPPPRRPWSRRRKLFVGAIALLAIAMATLWTFNRSGSIRQKSEVEAIRAAGHPVTFAEVQAQRVKIPDAENSALKIVPLFDELEERVGQPPMPLYGSFGSDWAEAGERLSPEMMGIVGPYLEARRDLLAKLHEAAKLKRGAYPIAWTADGFSTLLPHLSRIRAATRLLCLEAIHRANRGDIDGAMDSAFAALRVDESLGDEPTLISMLVRIACETAAIDALQQVMALGRPGEPAIARFRAELVPLADDKRGLVRAIDGERALMMTFYAALKTGKASTNAFGTPTTGASAMDVLVKLLPGYVDMNETQYLRKTRALWATADLPLKDYLREILAVDKAIPTMSSFYVFAKSLTPSYGRAAQLYVLSRVRIRAAVAALDAETFYRRHGRWPTKLDDLVRETGLPARLLADTFNDDKPMRYKIDGTGCVIYSLGDDGTDDGGTFTKPKNGGHRDAGFRLLSPEQRGRRTTTQPISEQDLEQIARLRAETQPAAAQSSE